MATRSTISLKISSEDKGKTFHFDENKLPTVKIGDENVKITCSNKFIGNIGDVKIIGDYLTIYHHWDSYPKDGVGETLIQRFNDYDSILNLLCGGDASTINRTEIIQYCPWRGESWEFVCPDQSNEEPSVDENYAYLFKDDKWFFKSRYDKDWVDLEQYLKTEE